MNWIQQNPLYRPQPQNIAAFSEVRDVDPVVATWAGIWAQESQSFKAWEPGGFHINELRKRTGDAVGPSVIDEPPFTWWKNVVDTNVAQTMIAPLYEERAGFKAWEPGRFHILENKVRTGDAVGPSIIDEPSFAWIWEGAVEPYLTKSIMPPVSTEMPSDYRSPDRSKIDVRNINEPDTDWQYSVESSIYASYVPALDNRYARYRAYERNKIDVRAINTPEFSPWTRLPVDAIIATYAGIWAEPQSFRARQRAGVNVANIIEPLIWPTYPPAPPPPTTTRPLRTIRWFKNQ